MDGDLVQLAKPFRLRHVLLDEQGVQVLQVGQAHELRHIRIVPDIAFPARILVAPVLRRHAEERHVQHVRLRGINQVGLARAQFRRHKVLLDRVGVDPVVDLGQIAPDVPAKLLEFLVLEPLKFLDEIEFEFDGNPGGELEGDVLVGVGAAIAPDLEIIRWRWSFDPLAGRQRKAGSAPACFLNPSNSTGLKSGLFNCSQSPRNSMVFRLRIQFLTMSAGASLFLYFAISVREI